MNRPSPSREGCSHNFLAVAENYRRPGTNSLNALAPEDRLSPADREMMALLARIEVAA
jgi:hypothetical protein